MDKVYVVMCRQEYNSGYEDDVKVYIVDVVANDVLAMELMIDCEKRDSFIKKYYQELQDSWLEEGLADEYSEPVIDFDPNLENEFDERYDTDADSHEYWFDVWEVRGN